MNDPLLKILNLLLSPFQVSSLYLGHWRGGPVYVYRTRAIITRDLYTFYPLFEVQKRFFQGAFFLKFWPYVWLVFKSGF